MIRISLGTAAHIGLIKMRMDVSPSTAYLLYGEGCTEDCSFCIQARSAGRPAGRLGRVVWPLFPRAEVFTALQEAVTGKGLQRICLQAVRDPAGQDALGKLMDEIRQLSLPLPFSASLPLNTIKEVEYYFNAGADRLSIALDAATRQTYLQHKGGSFQRRLRLILDCARRWKGRIGTHIICGLGETEEELIRLLALLVPEGVTVGLFAFTPLKGTRLAGGSPPEPGIYRRIQAVHYLLQHGLITAQGLVFRGKKLLSWGLAKDDLQYFLREGAAFRTSGCSGCNRPFYNERPGGFIYNYPRPLEAAEVNRALSMIL